MIEFANEVKTKQQINHWMAKWNWQWLIEWFFCWCVVCLLGVGNVEFAICQQQMQFNHWLVICWRRHPAKKETNKLCILLLCSNHAKPFIPFIRCGKDQIIAQLPCFFMEWNGMHVGGSHITHIFIVGHCMQLAATIEKNKQKARQQNNPFNHYFCHLVPQFSNALLCWRPPTNWRNKWWMELQQ